MLKATSIFVLILAALSLKAQKDTLRYDSLHTIEVSDLRTASARMLQMVTPIPVSERPSNVGMSLADLMQRHSTAFIRQYGPGMLASPGLRGTGSAHTALVWNGFNLQSSMNGQLDLSLIPAMLFSGFTVSEGASNTRWGSGAIGGVIALNQEMPIGLSVHLEGGSFQYRNLGLSAGWKLGKTRFIVAMQHSGAENNFRFRNTAVAGYPYQFQQNSRWKTGGLQMQVQHRIGKGQSLELAFWLQEANRHIPPIMSIPMAVAKQFDNTLRSAATWKLQKNTWQLSLRAGYFRESITFNDSLTHIHSGNTAHTGNAELEYLRYIGTRHTFQLGAFAGSSKAYSPGYNHQWATQQRMALFALWKSWLMLDKLNFHAGLRKEWANVADGPLTPSAGLQWFASQILVFNTQVSGTYRIPTLNDLYWMPGGNVNLLPEQGWAAEFNFRIGDALRKEGLHFDAGIFQNRIQNWIVWVPSSLFWTPHNVHTVESKGIQSRLSTNYRLGKARLLSSHGVQWVDASPVKTSNPDVFKTNRQLIYLPRHTQLHTLGLKFKRLFMELQATYTGLRYTSSDNSSSLPAFWLLNMHLEYSMKIKQHDFHVFARINNILGEEYQVLSWRPMPLQNAQLGVRMQFNPSTPKINKQP